MPYFDLDPLLETMLDYSPGISDLNLSVGRPPQVELDGQLKPVAYAGIERLLPYQTELIAMRLLAGKRDLADKLVGTLGHMAYGWFVASIAGIALGAMIGSSRTMRSYVAPSLEFLRPLPVSAPARSARPMTRRWISLVPSKMV